MTKPNFFIVGAPKCGTTAMNDYLSQHPGIFMAPKELHYFGADLKTRIKLSESEYLQYFREARMPVIGESSVWYLFSDSAAKEIRAFSPDAKILIMLRNPVDVLYALHSQNLFDGNEDVRDFEQAISLDDGRKKGNDLANAVDFYAMPGYKETALFSHQVKRYLDVFGDKNVRIVLFEDFVSGTDREVRDTLRFLELDPNAVIDYKIVNPNKQVRSFYLHRLIKTPPGSLKKIARILIPFKKARHGIMKKAFDKNIKEKGRDRLDTSVQRNLREYFSDDIKSLEKIIGRDLSSWLK